jgi:hypothetical protein
MREKRDDTGKWRGVEGLKERNSLEDMFTDGITILKWNLNRMGGCGMD